LDRPDLDDAEPDAEPSGRVRTRSGPAAGDDGRAAPFDQEEAELGLGVTTEHQVGAPAAHEDGTEEPDGEYEYEYVYDDDEDPELVYEDELEGDYVYVGDEPSWGRRFAVIGLFFAVFVFGVLGYTGFWLRSKIDPGGSTDEVSLVVPPDAGLATISRLLEENQVVEDATIFRYYAKWKDIQTVKAGTYDKLYKHDSMQHVIDRLNIGPLPPKFTDVNFPEGLWVSDVQTRLVEKLPDMNAAEFLLSLGVVRSKYQPKDASIDGFLFPATYRVAETDKDNELALVQQMVAKFDVVGDELGLGDATAKLGNAAGSTPIAPYDAVKVASLIEGEAKVPEDRARIARVIYNRLKQNMTLGIDAAIFVALGEHKTELTKADLDIDSPYNLRKVKGLPPKPINSPGRESLEAALNPSTEQGASGWLYYVLKDKEGHHYFTNDYNDFLRKTEEARANGLL
jgi:UPF0755 protein